MPKEEHHHALASLARTHIADRYSDDLKISTDGSILANGQAGGGFVILDLNIRKSYHLALGYSIFSAEPICHVFVLFSILFCVDSKAVLQALENEDNKERHYFFK